MGKKMRIKFTREEVIIIYEFLKKINLKLANKECAVDIITDIMKIKDTAQKIKQENTDIIEALQDDQFKQKNKEYQEIKSEVEEYIKKNGSLPKDSDLYKKFESIWKEYKPLYENFTDTVTKAILQLDQEFEFSLKKLKLEDIVEILDKSEVDYTVESISMIYKIIE